MSDTLRSRRPPSCCCRRPAARRGALPARLRDAGRPGTRPRGWFAPASMTRVTGACASAEELGSRRPGVRVEVSRRDQLEPTPDPYPHALRAAHSMVARLDPHSEYCMLHTLTGRCRAPAARQAPHEVYTGRLARRTSRPIDRLGRSRVDGSSARVAPPIVPSATGGANSSMRCWWRGSP